MIKEVKEEWLEKFKGIVKRNWEKGVSFEQVGADVVIHRDEYVPKIEVRPARMEDCDDVLGLMKDHVYLL